MIPESVNSVIKKLEEEQKLTKKQLSEEESKNKCKSVVIAKEYKNKEDMLNDNDKIIYYDKKYDNTPYSILDKYESQRLIMNTDDFYDLLVNEVTEKYKYPLSEAPSIATSLINKHKIVRDDEYAIIFSTNEERMTYFKRVDGKWKEDSNINNMNIANEDMFCNLQTDCIEIENKYNTICESYDMNKKELTENALKDMIGQFDNKYEITRNTLLSELETNQQYRMDVFNKLEQMRTNNNEQYNNEKYKIGLLASDKIVDNEVSPYIGIRQVVLGQSNFIKKQQDIVQFAIKYTREANVSNSTFNQSTSEDINWRYCITSGSKLLPSFIYTLAVTYIENPNNYDAKVEEIIRVNGAVSEDNEGNWVDESSGYVIKSREFDTEEGYEDGFKKKTRDILEQDAGDALLSSKEKSIKYSTPENKMIYNIISSLSGFMGINMNDQVEFIVKNVVNVLHGGILPLEEEYKEVVKERSKQGKKVIPYETLYHTTLLYLTLGTFLIGIQTAVPSIKTRATFPGCVRSFTGYPFEGVGDLTGLKYLTCIAYKIRKETIVPWNVLMRQKEQNIEEKIKVHIDNYLLEIPDIKRRFEEKIEYLVLNPGSDIPAEYELSRWTGFLPPLVPLKMKTLENITQDFKTSLLSQLKSGNTGQKNKISVVLAKIIYFSLGVQEQIQNVLNKKKWLLSNASNEPFLENACCNTDNQENVIQYFIKEDSEILSYINITKYLSEIIQDIRIITRAPTLYCRENSKILYGSISDEFSEQFIRHL
jgi:hypothetical protein